jgi:glycosyltransferase involved in cell wall biosynthesis
MNSGALAHVQQLDPGSTSVVICAYTDRRWTQLIEAVDSVRTQSPPPDEIVLVIDHNAALFARAEQSVPMVRVVQNAGPQGLSGARNTGVDAARGEIVCFLDDDAVARRGWLAALTHGYSDPSVIGTGGTAVARWEHPRPGWLPEEFYWVIGCTHRGLPTAATPIRNPIGCNMSFRRSAFDLAGGFDTEIGRIGATPLGCEETEFAIRVHAIDNASRVMFAPPATVDHLVTADRLSIKYFLSRCWAEGLSKAVVAARVGTSGALESERAYVLRTLPAGVVSGVWNGVTGTPSGFAQAATIIVGLAVTTLGYVRGRVALRAAAWRR